MDLRLVIFLTEDVLPVGSTAGTLPICTVHQREKKKSAAAIYAHLEIER